MYQHGFQVQSAETSEAFALHLAVKLGVAQPWQYCLSVRVLVFKQQAQPILLEKHERLQQQRELLFTSQNLMESQ